MSLSDKEARRIQAWARRSIDRLTRQAPALAKGPAAARVARFRRIAQAKIPATDRLQQLLELLPGTRGRAQQVLVWAHACMLEVNSGGVLMLFDRYNRRDRGKMERALEAIGAHKARRALARRRGGKAFDLADEIEARLLAYCQAHVEELAA